MDSDFAGFESPETGRVYFGQDATISTADSLRDGMLYATKLEGGLSKGGAELLNMRSVPWPQYEELDEDERELVQSNMHLVVEPPVEYGQHVMKRVNAFINHDTWLKGFNLENNTQNPDVDWNIEPYVSDHVNARYPKNIEDVYEKYHELDEKIDYDRIRSGEVYLRNGEPKTFGPKTMQGRENVTELGIGRLTTTKLDPEDIHVVPPEQTAPMDEERYRELYGRDDVWMQSRPGEPVQTKRKLEAVYATYVAPQSEETRELIESSWDGFMTQRELSDFPSEG